MDPLHRFPRSFGIDLTGCRIGVEESLLFPHVPPMLTGAFSRRFSGGVFFGVSFMMGAVKVQFGHIVGIFPFPMGAPCANSVNGFGDQYPFLS